MPAKGQYCQTNGCYHGSETHLQVLFSSLLPLLCHGAGPDGAGKHAGKGEDGKCTGNDCGREEEDVAALIWGRGSAGAVGTKGNVVGCNNKIKSA